MNYEMQELSAVVCLRWIKLASEKESVCEEK